jgi:hypothetical protein
MATYQYVKDIGFAMRVKSEWTIKVRERSKIWRDRGKAVK